MRRKLTLAIGSLAVFCILGSAALAQEPSAPYQIETIAEGLEYPWSIAFLPSGDMLVTERPGRLRMLSSDGVLSPAFGGVPEVYAEAQAGLFDVVLHPDFETTGWIYLAYAHGIRAANATRLVRARIDGTSLTDLEVLFTVSPTKATAAHYGGRILFLEDGTLVLTLGDGFDYRERAQHLSDHLGTFVRLNDDGSVPDDNPFVGVEGALPEIWTYGNRSPQGLVRDPITGVIYSHEHGPQGGDEINVMVPGANYGWPVVTYGLDYSGQIVTPYTEYPGMVDPLTYWVPSIAPTGLAIYRGQMFPEWDGDLFVGALIAGDAPPSDSGPVGGHVRRMDMEDGQIVGEEILFAEIDARIRDVRVAPDGSLYILTDEEDGRVLRIVRAP
ncbi:PQQ-dependent sugar dehydrogenase [bacterium AH-315-P15]|nr:PQQ-dependent sugar dehydrogenase [bacterium AH-315-P15]